MRVPGWMRQSVEVVLPAPPPFDRSSPRKNGARFTRPSVRSGLAWAPTYVMSALGIYGIDSVQSGSWSIRDHLTAPAEAALLTILLAVFVCRRDRSSDSE